MVVFRGTNDLHGWVENLRAGWTGHPWGDVHAGFLRCWDVLQRRVRLAVGDRRAVLTGHSLGGAMATLAAASLSRVLEVVTFGCPRVGDRQFAKSYLVGGPPTTRYVHRFDPVPLVPAWLTGWRHVCRSRWWSGDAWRDGYSWSEVLRQLWRTVVTTRGLLARLWDHHGIDRYITALESR